MPYKQSETTDKDKMSAKAPMGPGFTEAELSTAFRMEVWCSGFKDPGEDYCEFRVFDNHGNRILTRVVPGY